MATGMEKIRGRFARGREAGTSSGEALTGTENALLADADVYETEDSLIIRADLPGVEKGNVQIDVDESNTLQIRARNGFQAPAGAILEEWEPADYFRSFRLGEEFDKNNVKAKLENGCLELTLAKREEVKPRRIQIQA